MVGRTEGPTMPILKRPTSGPSPPLFRPREEERGRRVTNRSFPLEGTSLPTVEVLRGGVRAPQRWLQAKGNVLATVVEAKRGQKTRREATEKRGEQVNIDSYQQAAERQENQKGR